MEFFAGKRRFGTAARVMALAAVMGAMVWLRVLWGSKQAWQEGERCLQRGEPVRAVTFFDRSIHWYAPLNPYVHRSAERLWEMARRAEEDGNPALAGMALRAIERGYRSSAGAFQPGADWLARVEVKARKYDAPQVDEGVAYHGHAPEKPAPDPFWAVVLEIGFLGWIGSFLGWIFFVLRERKKTASRTWQAPVWTGLALVFFFLWLMGLIKA